MSTSHAISDTICETRKVRERLNFSKPNHQQEEAFIYNMQTTWEEQTTYKVK